MGPDTIFFSYSRADSDFALKLAKDLRQAGADVWMDQLDIGAGDRWDLTIEKALNESKRLLVILTPDSISSNNVMDEVSYALEQGKKVIPILLKPCNVSFRLRRLQQVDFTEYYDEAFKRLLIELNLEKEKHKEEEEKPKEKEEAKKRNEGEAKKNYKIPFLVAGSIAVLAIIVWNFMGGNPDNSEEILEWNTITAIGSLEAYRNYQNKYPNGLYSDEVKDSINKIMLNDSLNQKITEIDKPEEEEQAQTGNQTANDRTTTSYAEPSNTTSDTQPLGIGDKYQGGIIYYIDNSGKHGLIAAEKDIDGEFNWLNAKQQCTSLGTGWRLPTKDELDKLCQNKDLVGGFTTKGYWSASESENNAGKVWYQIIRNCYQNQMTPDYLWHVRAVRTF